MLPKEKIFQSELLVLIFPEQKVQEKQELMQAVLARKESNKQGFEGIFLFREKLLFLLLQKLQGFQKTVLGQWLQELERGAEWEAREQSLQL